MREKCFIVATKHELRHIVPPFNSNSISLAIGFPNANTTQTLKDDVRTRDTSVKVIVRVCRAITAAVCTQVIAGVAALCAACRDSIIDVHLWRKVSSAVQGNCDILERLQKWRGNNVFWGRPYLVIHRVSLLRRWP